MKRPLLLALILYIFLPHILLSQNTTRQDSIKIFYESLFSTLKKEYLHKKNVNWKTVKAYTLDSAKKAQNFQESLEATAALFDTISCNHCSLFYGESNYTSTRNKRLSADDFSPQFVSKLQTQPPFEVKRINENIAYINMPGMLMINLSKDSLAIATQHMYDEIAAVAKNNFIEGWVVDLRFNGGGNVFPMLAALYHILGDNVMYTSIDLDGKLKKMHTLKDGGFYVEDNLKVKVTPSIVPDTTAPVSLIIGKLTGSSGEDIAVAFKNREQTTFIGQKTYGFLSGNSLVELPFGAKIAVTTSYIADQNLIYEPFITPDISVSKKDNFDNLLDDQNIIESLKFINNTKG